MASQPTFFAAQPPWADAGSALLGVAALCGHLHRPDRQLHRAQPPAARPVGGRHALRLGGQLDAQSVPRNAILMILAVSVVLPFFGRTAISWIVDVTTVGATIAYAFTSASAWKTARQERNRRMCVMGVLGLVVPPACGCGRPRSRHGGIRRPIQTYYMDAWTAGVTSTLRRRRRTALPSCGGLDGWTTSLARAASSRSR